VSFACCGMAVYVRMLSAPLSQLAEASRGLQRATMNPATGIAFEEWLLLPLVVASVVLVRLRSPAAPPSTLPSRGVREVRLLVALTSSVLPDSGLQTRSRRTRARRWRLCGPWIARCTPHASASCESVELRCVLLPLLSTFRSWL
jgi:hypothetical protein